MRGQAHTVEAFTAAVLVIGGLIFATQATAVTPLSASTSNQHIENQQGASIDGLLATSAENGSLREAVLYWNPDDGEFHNASETDVYTDGPPNAFGTGLNELLLDRRIAFNVVVRYPDGAGGTERERMVRMGSPSDNAVSATRTVGLYDDSNLTSDGYEGETLGSLSDGEFYAPEVGDGRLYTVVEVEVIAWRK
jgi:hypothetical protein